MCLRASTEKSCSTCRAAYTGFLEKQVIQLKAQLQEKRTQHHVGGDSIEVPKPPNITALFMSCCMMIPGPPLHICVYASGAS